MFKNLSLLFRSKSKSKSKSEEKPASTRTGSAKLARDRLQILVSHERNNPVNQPDYLPALKQAMLDLIFKFVKIDKNDLKIKFGHHDNVDTLEFKVDLPPDGKKNKSK